MTASSTADEEPRARQRLIRRASYYLDAMARLPNTRLDLEGAVLETCSHVFNPAASSSTRQICSWMSRRSPVDSVLDMGTGTGAIGIVAALHGCRRVVMTDSNPLAVDCARRNVRRNRVEVACQVEQRRDTAALRDQFDLVIFAGPYLWFAAPRGLARRHGDLVDSMFDEADGSKTTLLQDAHRLLKPGGRVLLQVGSISRWRWLIEIANGFGLDLVETSNAPDGREEHLILEFALRTG